MRVGERVGIQLDLQTRGHPHHQRGRLPPLAGIGQAREHPHAIPLDREHRRFCEPLRLGVVVAVRVDVKLCTDVRTILASDRQLGWRPAGARDDPQFGDRGIDRMRGRGREVG